MKEDIIKWFESWIDKLDRTCVDDPEEFLIDLALDVDFMKEAIKYLKKEEK